jgi:hypothetical protein
MPLPAADVRVFRYTQLQGWIDVLELIGCGLVAFDEVQELRRGEDSGKGSALPHGWPSLAAAARALGHADLQLRPRDLGGDALPRPAVLGER